jgi:hypothetical protein
MHIIWSCGAVDQPTTTYLAAASISEHMISIIAGAWLGSHTPCTPTSPLALKVALSAEQECTQ